MPSPATELELAIAAFRRDQASGYLRELAGQPRDPRFEGRARAYLASERAEELLEQARPELTPGLYAASCAHLARASFELRYAAARSATSQLLSREVAVEGDTRSVGALLGEWAGLTRQRDRVIAAMSPVLEEYGTKLIEARSEADHTVGVRLGKLQPARHADAGPEDGRERASKFLDATAEVTREAIAYAERAQHQQVETGLDALWVALGQDMRGLVPREGRLRRLAAEWEPLGLRRMLATRARAAVDHAGPYLAAQLVALELPAQVRVSACEREYGLASELSMAETIGRALGLAHGSATLPTATRYPSVGTVARTVGALAVVRMLEPHFLRKVRGLSVRESEQVARLCALWFLLDARLSAAQTLGRTLRGETALDQVTALAEQALLGSVPRGPAAVLIVRASGSAVFRGRAHAPALAWAFRERFDEDWYLNPRTAEPLRGALAQAGELSVEAFAQELDTTVERGIAKLSELF
ncbi:MAG TPA: hypothetical protein VFX59_06930 [Polyangiales bacterium]|nr:hypothetical protein [Polyangiales bacterium]